MYVDIKNEFKGCIYNRPLYGYLLCDAVFTVEFESKLNFVGIPMKVETSHMCYWDRREYSTRISSSISKLTIGHQLASGLSNAPERIAESFLLALCLHLDSKENM